MTRLFQFYTDFIAEQFAEDDYFRQWILQPEESLEEFWTSYLQANPGQEETILQARQLVETNAYNNYGSRALGSEEKMELKENIFRQLRLAGQPEKKTAPVKRLPWWGTTLPWRGTVIPRRAMAAAAIFLLAAAVYLLVSVSGSHPGRQVLLAERTGANEMKTIVLPDSSVVILNANSALEYNPELPVSENREVKLEGNAFFRVKKDRSFRKFVVHARSLEVTVLGTELNVDARSAATEVTLISGKVKVTNVAGTQDPVYLLPGDKVSLDTLKQTLVRSATNTLLYSAWTEGRWNFQHTSLEEIGKLIGAYYGTAVTFNSDKNKRLSINAIIPVGPLQELIPILEQTLHIRMVLSDSRLTIE